MADKKEIEEALKNFPNEAELNMDLVSDAENLTRELYCGKHASKPRTRRKIWGVAVLSLCFCALLVGIIVPLAVRSPAVDEPVVEPPVIHYFNDKELVKEQIFDVEGFVAQNAVNAKFFSESQQSFLFRIKETNIPVIIYQEYNYYDENNYDIIKLEICFSDDQFSRYDRFQNIDDIKNIDDIEVKYSIVPTSNKFKILAKCHVDSYYYYFEILSFGGEERIDYYINYLFK